MAQTFAKIEISLRRRKWKQIKTALGAALVFGLGAFAIYHFWL